MKIFIIVQTTFASWESGGAGLGGGRARTLGGAFTSARMRVLVSADEAANLTTGLR